jgi:two-component system phosphate regulon response regulator PhoB
MVEAMHPDIVLLDVNLGAESGLDCLPQLLQLGAHRVLILTGNADSETRSRSLSAGACEVLHKGDPAEKIRAAIRRHSLKNDVPDFIAS